MGANPAEVSGAERSDERASAAAPVSGQESPTLSVEPSMTELGIGATGETGAELSASSSTGPPASPPRVPHRLDFMTGAPLLEISTSLGSSARHSGGRSPVSPSSAWLSAAAAHGHSGPTSPGGLRSPHQRLTIDIPPQRAGSPQEASRTLDWSVSSPSSTGLHAVPIQLQRLRQRRMLQQQRELAHVALRPLPPLPPHLPDPSTECMHDLLVDASDTAVCFGVDLAWMCDMLSTAGSRSSQELAAP